MAHEVFRELPFPFPDGRFPPELGAVVQRTVSDGELPALTVIHAPDNSWIVLDGINDPNPDGRPDVPEALDAARADQPARRVARANDLAVARKPRTWSGSGPAEREGM